MDAASRRPTEEMSLLFDVWLVMHLASGVLDDALADAGLSADDFGLYSLLRVFGPATPSQIARWTGMRPTTVSAALRRMAGRRHSVQHHNPDDGRSYLVGLSPRGAAAHGAAAGAFLAVLGEVDEALQPDALGLRLALQRLDAVLRSTAGLDPRPYWLAGEASGGTWQLSYTGSPLTPAQEAAVRTYVQFVQSTPAGLTVRHDEEGG